MITPPNSPSPEDETNPSSSGTCSEVEMQVKEEDEAGEEEAPTPMSVEGAEGQEIDTERDGVIMESENHLLDEDDVPATPGVDTPAIQSAGDVLRMTSSQCCDHELTS